MGHSNQVIITTRLVSRNISAMPRPALNKLQTSIQVFLPPDDKKAFSRWCEANGMTMSEVIRGEIKSKIEEGYKLK